MALRTRSTIKWRRPGESAKCSLPGLDLASEPVELGVVDAA